MDWYSRYVLTWELSNTLEKQFCLDALERALAISQPEIFNMDQGAQFTSSEFIGKLEKAGIKVSMDGRGRVFDNIFVERLWRTVKYEEVYLHSYETVRDARANLTRYFHFYNVERLHESLGYRTPHEVYFGENRTYNGQAGELIQLKEPQLLSVRKLLKVHFFKIFVLTSCCPTRRPRYQNRMRAVCVLRLKLILSSTSSRMGTP